MKTALITGATGQDGSYLCEMLLEKGYMVIGTKRRSSTNTELRLSNCLDHPNFILEECDITDFSNVSGLINEYKPDECYNTAAMSHVGTSFKQPLHSFDVDAVGPLNILESIRQFSPNTKLCQCSTSEMFGSQFEVVDGVKMQTLNTPLKPNSPYAIAKVAAHESCRLYRESYDVFAATTICFNHEGPRRGENFVTRKITKYAASLLKAKNEKRVIEPLHLGNIETFRDFGHAKDYVKAMYMTLQADVADDYIICTGKTHKIKDVCKIVFNFIGENYEDHIVIDPKFYRPCEVPYLNGDNSETIKKIGWKPKIPFEDMLAEMLQEDIREIGA